MKVVLMRNLRLREDRLIFGPRSFSTEVKQACLACESVSLTRALHGPLSFLKAFFVQSTYTDPCSNVLGTRR